MKKKRPLTQKEIAMMQELRTALAAGELNAGRLQTFITSAHSKRGRPQIADADRRSKTFTMRLSEDEHAALADMAEKKGKTIAELVRAIIKKQ